MQRITETKADQTTVRRINISAILKLMRDRGTLARADLAKELGMTRNTASNIVYDLVEVGLLIETEYRRQGAGRPGLLLELSPNGGFAIGAEIDVNRIVVIVLDFVGNILWEESTPIIPMQSQEEVITVAEQLVQGALDWGRENSLRPLGIGLGLAGLVDAEEGCLTYAPTLGWENVPFKAHWEEKFKLPVHLDNEANTAALGYYAYADHFNARNLTYLSIGAGMAAGLILDGHLFRGSCGFAGQAGHMKIRTDGHPCTCGDHGCWVTEVGIPALVRKTGDAQVDLDKMAQKLRDGDSEALAIVDGMAEMLGLGIANLVNLFNLDRIVLGGAMRPILPFMLEKAQDIADARALQNPRANAKIKVSGRDNDSVFGCAYLVLEDIFSNPSTLMRSRKTKEDDKKFAAYNE